MGSAMKQRKQVDDKLENLGGARNEKVGLVAQADLNFTVGK